MLKATVSLQVYESKPVPLMSGGVAYKHKYAFSVSFPNGTYAWSHSRANVRTLVLEYGRSIKQCCAVHWDASCGTYDP